MADADKNNIEKEQSIPARFEASSGNEALESVGDFRLLTRITLDYTEAVVTKWQSSATGLQVVHVDYDNSIINGYFAVATEIFDDSGCPHTLEHLCFHGSENFPHSDALSRRTSRTFSSTPNAYTALDKTVFTLSTAGEASFLKLLPVYLDHMLYPRLTQSRFVTEVFHINKEGHDAGVVYSEMQGYANGDDLAYRRELYPEESAYRSETGGRPNALRELDLQKIKDYHASYYVPHNICLVVTGRLSTQALLEEVSKTVEAQAIAHKQDRGVKPDDWKRPFVDTESAVVPKIDVDRSITVECPSKESKFGSVRMVMIGPQPDDDITGIGLSILEEYLTGNVVAPLHKKFIDLLFPYCTSISVSNNTRPKFTETSIIMTGVPVRHLDKMEKKLRKALRKIVAKGIDIEKIHTILDQYSVMLRKGMEEFGGEVFSGYLLEDFVYGDGDAEKLRKSFDIPAIFSTLKSWSSQDWADLITKWMIEPKMLVVRCRPSPKLSDKKDSDEKERLEKQVEDLGEEGLKKHEEILEAAKKENEDPTPDEVIGAIPLPDINSISWIPVQSASTVPETSEIKVLEESEALAAHLNADTCALPFTLHFDQVTSDFISVSIYMSFSNIPEELMPYLYIFEYWFFANDVILEDGTKLSEEELLLQLDKDTIAYSLDWSSLEDTFCLSIDAESSKYDLAVRWLHRLLYSSKITTSKIQSRLATVKQCLPDYFRDEDTVLYDAQRQEIWSKRETSRAYTISEMIKWIPDVEREVKRNPKAVVKKLEELRAFMLDPSRMQFSVRGGILHVKEPRTTWSKYFSDFKYAPLAPFPDPARTMSALGKKPSKKAVVISLASIDSSRSLHVALGCKGRANPDNPAMEVAIEVLTGSELYFWKRVRGEGLAYSVSAYNYENTGQGFFSVYKSPNAYKAYAAAKAVVQGLVDGTIPLEAQKVEAAKCSTVYAWAESWSTRSEMARFRFQNRVFWGRPKTWLQDHLAAIQAVTNEEILDVMKKYILPLFDPETSATFVVCAPNQAEEITKGFTEEGFEVESRKMDDKLPWDTWNNGLGMKAMEALVKTIMGGHDLIERTRGALHI